MPTSLEWIRSLENHYQSGKQKIATDFFQPCLTHCSSYSRAAGYFSSSALKTWSQALASIISKVVDIRLIIAPILSAQDKEALRQATTEADRARLLLSVGDRIIEETMEFASDPENVQLRLRLFAWMVANNQLKIRLAQPHHVEDPGIYHEKFGIFEFPWGDKVAFDGSANESQFGHLKNYEKIHVFRSWIDADVERVTITEMDFENEWAGNAEGLTVVPLSERAIRAIRQRAPIDRPQIDGEDMAAEPPSDYDPKWRHQEEASSRFAEQKRGIIEMATGTGKTRTALKILTNLVSLGEIDGAIITVDGTDLLDQWFREVLSWVSKQARRYSVFRHYADNHELQTFALDQQDSLLIISRQQLGKLFKVLSRKDRKRLLIVHDEVHGLGSTSLRESLSGEHEAFGYCLGLSATPEREYDAEGSAFIDEEIGPVIYQFGLEDAIRRGILCEFEYVPLEYDLTDDDRKRLQLVYSRKARRAEEGNPMSEEEVWIELSRVYKTAAQKPSIFYEYLSLHSEIVKSSIIFVEEKWYGDQLLSTIDQYTHLYRTYYAEDDRENLVSFARGDIDCLITCHRISQGIDIRNLRCVVLFSSARGKLETIQRIGRCLRTDPAHPTKRAVVLDFVRRVGPEDRFGSPDQERRLWLTRLSEIKGEDSHAN